MQKKSKFKNRLGDSFPEPSGCFRNAAIPSRSCQDAFATLRFLPAAVRTFSQRRDSFPEPSGCFRNAAILRFIPEQLRKFYSEEFKERVLTAYYNSNKSVLMIARRFEVNKETVGSWVYRKRKANNSKKRSS
jgi:transposase-like protein